MWDHPWILPGCPHGDPVGLNSEGPGAINNWGNPPEQSALTPVGLQRTDQRLICQLINWGGGDCARELGFWRAASPRARKAVLCSSFGMCSCVCNPSSANALQ